MGIAVSLHFTHAARTIHVPGQAVPGGWAGFCRRAADAIFESCLIGSTGQVQAGVTNLRRHRHAILSDSGNRNSKTDGSSSASDII
jgi:hypothetical protein